MFEPISKFFFNIWLSFQTTSWMVSSNVTNTLIQKYPNAVFKVFWTYNYYSVVILDFLEKNKIYLRKTASFSMPIEDIYSARFFYYVSSPDKYNLYFEHHPHFIETNSKNKNEIKLYKTPEYTLCGFNLPDDVQKTPTKSKAQFINIIFSNEKTREPLTIKLDKSYFQVGNEVLTAAHILLLLNTTYTPSKFVFNDEYELKIMDSTLNLVILKSNEWIKFDDSKMGYTKMVA